MGTYRIISNQSINEPALPLSTFTLDWHDALQPRGRVPQEHDPNLVLLIAVGLVMGVVVDGVVDVVAGLGVILEFSVFEPNWNNWYVVAVDCYLMTQPCCCYMLTSQTQLESPPED